MGMRIKVDNGKYEFVQQGSKIDILRNGQPWIRNLDGANAIHSLMADLDAARLVLEAARKCVAGNVGTPYEHLGTIKRLGEALDAHARLVDDTQSPSPWAKPAHDEPAGPTGSAP